MNSLDVKALCTGHDFGEELQFLFGIKQMVARGLLSKKEIF